jgi:hypothetical protein
MATATDLNIQLKSKAISELLSMISSRDMLASAVFGQYFSIKMNNANRKIWINGKLLVSQMSKDKY